MNSVGGGGVEEAPEGGPQQSPVEGKLAGIAGRGQSPAKPHACSCTAWGGWGKDGIRQRSGPPLPALALQAGLCTPGEVALEAP